MRRVKENFYLSTNKDSVPYARPRRVTKYPRNVLRNHQWRYAQGGARKRITPVLRVELTVELTDWVVGAGANTGAARPKRPRYQLESVDLKVCHSYSSIPFARYRYHRH
jgi:hypothetical protein